MIHYDLRCSGGHGFDGWFRSSAAFDHQAGLGLLTCPACGSPDVSRALMAPRLSRNAAPPRIQPERLEAPKDRAPPPAPVPKPRDADGPPPAAMPDGVRALLQRLRTEVEKRCDYVGPHFAETARAIHNGDTAPRPIYGEATPDQAEALAEDGIEVSQLPWVPRADG